MFIDIAKSRYSCRNFTSKQVDKDILLKVIEAFRVAPSAVNYQPWHVIVIEKKENKEKVYQTYQRDWIKTAPLLLIACTDHSVSWKRNDGKDYADIDVSIAVDHLTLQAAELGLATCWVCNFDRELLEQKLKLPINIEPVVIIPIGYPEAKADTERHNQKRKPVGDFVHWDNF